VPTLALAELLLVLVLVHPVVATRPAATTVTLIQVAVRRLKMFTDDLYAIRVTHGAAELNAQVNGPRREDARFYKSAQLVRLVTTKPQNAVSAPESKVRDLWHRMG
jgi:hypothetical protein